MLSYRHGYHAGNHADVLKHTVLVALLRHMVLKDKPFWVIDTHAGAGWYRFNHTFAQKTGEWRQGIGRIWAAADAPPAVADYLALVRCANALQPLPQAGRSGEGVSGTVAPSPRSAETLSVYPGSPWITRQLLRPGDRLYAYERHTSDAPALVEASRGDRAIRVTADDGFAGLRALWPPAPRRGLVLIDPSYEVKEDYAQVVDAAADALKRFATGILAIWYPRLARRESDTLPARLMRLSPGNWLHAALDVRARSAQGMYGSGVVVLNPPWTLPETLKPAMPWLCQRLGADAEASTTLEWQID